MSTPARSCTCPSIRRKARCAADTFPGAKSVPWARAANPDGTFKSASELRAIYEQEQGLDAERTT